MMSTTGNNTSSGSNSRIMSTNLSSLPFDLTGTNLLLVLIYGIIIVLLGIIFTKRLIHRVRISSKFFHQLTNPGAGGPKKLKIEIRKQLEDSMSLMYEPQLLMADDQRGKDTSNCLNYIYRMKTVDSFSELDQAMNDLNKDLCRPVGKNIRQHLLDVKSHSSGCLSSIRTNKLQNISDLYMRARYGSESYTSQDHERFVELSAEVVSVLRRRTHGYHKRSKGKKREFRRQDATFVSEEEQLYKDIQLKSNTVNDDDVTIVTAHKTTSFSETKKAVPETPSSPASISTHPDPTDKDPLL